MAKTDKKEQRRAPILRFKGFTDDWEQRQLGEIGTTYSGLSGKNKSDFEKGNSIFVTFLEVLNNPVLKNIDLTNKVEIKENEHQNKVKRNDILFNTSSETPEEVATSTVVDVNQDNLYLNSFCFGFRPNVQFSNYYIGYYLRSNHFRNRVFCLAQGISRYNISKKSLIKLKLSLPKLEEQDKISRIFNQIELLLTLYENKRKLLTALSQGLSQYLFSFSKEKNAIQMSLSSITVSETKGIAKENTLSLGNIEYLDTTRLNGGKAKLVSGKKDVDFRDIIVLWDGSNAGKIYYGFSGILGSTLKVFKLKDDINSEYVYYYLKFKQNLILHKFRTPNIPHVSKDFSQRFNLPIPDKEKQNLIANILHLNELQINLINKKIEKLKQIKKSLLQNMFL